MRESNNEVLSKTPLMTKTTISKSATALNEAAPSHYTIILDSHKILFASTQETVTNPQSTISNPPHFIYIL